MTRKLASIKQIDRIEPIEGADAIETAIIGGWKSVVKKGEYAAGDIAIYCEVDSWIPTELAPFLSRGKEPREYNGVKGERLRTMRLRGVMSQGLLLPISLVDDITITLGDDVTEYLDIQKWEREIPAQLAGMAKCNFPSFIPKTDQERAQNLVAEINDAIARGALFEETEKLEGSSMTAYLNDGEFGVCSRNLDLKRDENNTFWRVAIEQDLEAKLRRTGRNLAIQGELIGPGIQDNIYQLTNHMMCVFDVYDIDAGRYLMPAERRELTSTLIINHAPVLRYSAPLMAIEDLIAHADGQSVMGHKGTLREGVVFKQIDGGMSFKVVSNKYLMKSGT